MYGAPIDRLQCTKSSAIVDWIAWRKYVQLPVPSMGLTPDIEGVVSSTWFFPFYPSGSHRSVSNCLG